MPSLRLLNVRTFCLIIHSVQVVIYPFLQIISLSLFILVIILFCGSNVPVLSSYQLLSFNASFFEDLLSIRYFVYFICSYYLKALCTGRKCLIRITKKLYFHSLNFKKSKIDFTCTKKFSTLPQRTSL